MSCSTGRMRASPRSPARMSSHSPLKEGGRHNQAAMAAGPHLFPSRTEKLSPPAPMVLRQQRGRVGSRHLNEPRDATSAPGLNFFPPHRV